MLKIVTLAVAALSISAPAFAQTQLERSVGADAGQYTLGELAELKAAESDLGIESQVYFGNDSIRFSHRNAHNNTARAIFDQLKAEARNGE